MKDANITIAGSAKDQVATIGNILIETALSQGCAVFAWQEDEPKNLGKKNYHHIRISDTPADRPFSQADVLVDTQSTGQWTVTIRDDIDSSAMKRFLTNNRIEGHQIDNSIFANAELSGAVSAVTGLDFYTLVHHLARDFVPIGNEAVSGIQAATARGYAIAAGKAKDVPKCRLPVRKQRYVGFTGNDAIAMGAAYAGCRFIYSYSMTPSNRVVTFLENQESGFGKFARQIEQALAPVCSAIDERIKKSKTKIARQRNRLAWTAEELFLPCLADTPVVIILGQRPGPNCSKHSRTLLDDCLLGLCAGNDKTTRMVLTPQNAEDAFYKTILSFQMADMHHAPVIISADPVLAESLFSVGEIDPRRQSLFAYLSNPQKIKCRAAIKNISYTPGFQWNAFFGVNRTGHPPLMGNALT